MLDRNDEERVAIFLHTLNPYIMDREAPRRSLSKPVNDLVAIYDLDNSRLYGCIVHHLKVQHEVRPYGTNKTNSLT